METTTTPANDLQDILTLTDKSDNDIDFCDTSSCSSPGSDQETDLQQYEIDEISEQFQYKKSESRYYATILINGKEITGLLDSGANVTVIGRNAEEFLKNIKAKWYLANKSHRKIRTADGTTHSLDRYATFEVEFNGKKFPLIIYVIPALSQKINFGYRFLASLPNSTIHIGNSQRHRT